MRYENRRGGQAIFSPGYAQASAPAAPALPLGDSMDLSATRTAPRPAIPATLAPSGAAGAPRRSFRRGPLSVEERDRRFRQGLCMYCGEPGHMAMSCPARPAKPRGAPLNARTAALDVPEASGALEESSSAPEEPKN